MANFLEEDYLILIFLWILWCTLHSLMIAQSVTNFLKSNLGKNYRFYRLFFNIISVLTLIPVLAFSHSVKSPILFQYPINLF